MNHFLFEHVGRMKANHLFRLVAVFCGLFLLLGEVQRANAHPHVFLEANLEIVRNEKGEVTDILHVWRFDEIFSSSMVLDFDENGNTILEIPELEMIANETRASLSQYSYFTHVKDGDKDIALKSPDPYLVDFQDGQLLLIMSIALETPHMLGPEGFKIAVSDDTYYVAVEIADNDSIQISGKNTNCQWNIERPDFDALYARDAERLSDLFAAGPDEEVEGSDDYLTWVEFSCPA